MLTPDQLARIPYHSGPTTATIALVGEAPGSDEELDDKKRPFVGWSGQLLRAMMAKAGIDFESCYVTNILKERPPNNKYKKYERENPEQVKKYKSLLMEELKSLPNIRLLIPVGAEALEFITGKKSIENWRGSIIPSTILKDVKCVPIIHPAAILREWIYKHATQLDLYRCAEESKTSEIVLPARTYIIRPDFDTVIAYLETILRCDGLVSVDIETLKGLMVSIQFALSPKEGLCIPFQYRNGKSYWPIDQEAVILQTVGRVLRGNGRNRRLIGQNFCTFDTFMLHLYGYNYRHVLDNFHLDTMEGFQCLEPQLPKGLDFLTSIYTREPYYKNEGKEWNTRAGEDEFWTYGCKDVMVVSEIASSIERELHAEKLWDFYVDKYRNMAYGRMHMSLQGLPRSETTRATLADTFIKDIVREQARLTVLAGDNYNVKSPKQLKELFYEKMKLPKQYARGADGEYVVTTNEDAILALASIQPSKVFSHILKVRSLRTLYSTNIKPHNNSDGRVRCSFGFTETGRFTSYGCPIGP